MTVEALRLASDSAIVDLEQFRLGLFVELDQGTKDPEITVTNDAIRHTGKISLTYLKTGLATLEAEVHKQWAKKGERTT